MNHIRDYFLTDTALAGDKHVRVRWRHRADQLLQFLHHLAFEYRGEPRLRQLQPLLQLLGFFAQRLRLLQKRSLLQRLFHQAQQFLGRIRLAYKMKCAALDRFNGVVQRIMRGQNDDLRIAEILLEPLECFQSIGVGQLQIKQHQRGRICFHRAQSERRRRGGFRLITVARQ